MNTRDLFARAADEKLEAWMLERIEALVSVNSFTENVVGGNAVGDILAHEAAAVGLSVSRVPSQRFASHLVMRSQPSANAGIALVGHLDTVFPPGTFEGFSRNGDLARGPGVLDMKGGLIVVLSALRLLRGYGARFELPPVTFVVVSDEEVGSPEGRTVLGETVAQCSECLVFESGRVTDAIVTQRKGTGSVTAESKGRAAHAGNNHQDGANAIWSLCRFVDLAQRLTDYERGVTINVGRIEGGESKNTVPDRARAVLDLRFQRTEDAHAVMARLGEAAHTAIADVQGTAIELTGGPSRLPMERTQGNVALALAYSACARDAGLGGDESPLVGGGSDANTTSAMGLPTIDALGPRGKGFHTHDEYIEISSLVPKAVALASFLISRGGTTRTT